MALAQAALRGVGQGHHGGAGGAGYTGPRGIDHVEGDATPSEGAEGGGDLGAPAGPVGPEVDDALAREQVHSSPLNLSCNAGVISEGGGSD